MGLFGFPIDTQLPISIWIESAEPNPASAHWLWRCVHLQSLDYAQPSHLFTTIVLWAEAREVFSALADAVSPAASLLAPAW
jgi:hypothetical protein